MSAAESISVVFALALVLVTVSLRRLVFSWSAIGVFFVSNVLLICTGVLLFPWIRRAIEGWFPSYDLAILTEDEVSKAIILSCGGVIATLVAYQVSHGFFHSGRIRVVGHDHLQASARSSLGLNRTRLALCCVAGLTFAGIVILRDWNTLVEGVRAGFLAGNPSAVLEARMKMGQDYLFVLLVYNVLPFLGAALWLWSRLAWTWRLGVMAILFNGVVVGLLLSLFQKRPLVVFILALILVEMWLASRRAVVRGGGAGGQASRRRARRTISLLLGGGVIFSGLLVLYYFHTTVGRRGEGLVETVLALGLILVSRVIWRLALPALMYVHYFPGIEGFYGLRNIGKLAMALDWELYLDTKAVFEYFAGKEGTVASSALFDFYGAFGIVGWLLGACFLGSFLERLDEWLGGLEPTGANALLTVFMLIFVLYLSQASLPRSLLGYGGIPFLLAWLAVKRYRTSAWSSRLLVAE